MIELAPEGILPLLEEEQRLPKATDVTFTEKVYGKHDGCARLKAPKMSKGVGLSRKEAFIVRCLPTPLS